MMISSIVNSTRLIHFSMVDVVFLCGTIKIHLVFRKRILDCSPQMCKRRTLGCYQRGAERLSMELLLNTP